MILDIQTLLSKFDIQYSNNYLTRTQFTNLSPIDRAGSNDLSFCSTEGDNAIISIAKSNAGIILCRKDVEDHVYPNTKKKQTLIFVENPRLVFIKIAKYLKGERSINEISSNAIISKNAKIGTNSSLGNFAIIGTNCDIGDNVIIGDKVNLQNCSIGNNCIIQPGTIIGEDGFAFEREQNLELEIFPHFGRVKIEDNVLISSNCSIARGSLSDTVIGYGTKIDALCHVAHNVQIGKNTELTAGTIIGGGTIIGNNCWMGLNCTIKNKIKIGNNVIVGCGASVIRDIIDQDIVAGVPAKSIKNKITADKYKLFLMAGLK